MTQVNISEHKFGKECNSAIITTEGRGCCTIGDTAYAIYDHFKRMDIIYRFGLYGMDVRIILTDKHSFVASISSELYEQIHAIMMEKQRKEYFRKGE